MTSGHFVVWAFRRAGGAKRNPPFGLGTQWRVSLRCTRPTSPPVVMAEALQIPRDTLLVEELAREELVEMANLTSAQTGIAGTIFVSTAMGAHGPRVKYFQQPGRTQPSLSVSIADAPAVVANSLPARTVRQMSPQVIEWVLLNKDALLDFWHHGDTWTQPEVNDFMQKLRRV